MKEIALLIQLCAAGLCTPVEEARLDRAFERCRTAPSLVTCLSQQQPQVTPSYGVKR